jgi:hypothetical protein
MRKILSSVIGAVLIASTITANSLSSNATNDKPIYIVFNFPSLPDYGSPIRYCIQGLTLGSGLSALASVVLETEDPSLASILTGESYSWVFDHFKLQNVAMPFVIYVPPGGQGDATAVEFSTEYYSAPNSEDGYTVTTLQHVVNLCDCSSVAPNQANPELSPFRVEDPLFEEFSTHP